MILGRLSEYAYELASLTSAYPPFVLGRSAIMQPGEVPIFVFHTIEPKRFAAQLTFLVENGYRTIGLDEYMAIAARKTQSTGKEVLLTIDDARSSVWRYGFPLLLQYRAKAAVFVITGWTPEGEVRPRLETADERLVHEADPEDTSVCNWEELRSMRASGLVDVESHSHLHRRVFVGRRLLGLITERSNATASDAAFAPYLSPSVSPLDAPADRFLGFPLFRTEPLLAAPGMLEVAAGAAEAVSSRYREGLRKVTAASLRELASLLPASAFRELRPEEVRQQIRDDLAASQGALRAGLNDSVVGRHLCLPFTIGSETTLEVARELKFSSVFWGVSSDRKSNVPGADPLRSVRLKNDFLWRLPGAGRRSLPAIYFEKAQRRLAGIAPY